MMSSKTRFNAYLTASMILTVIGVIGLFVALTVRVVIEHGYGFIVLVPGGVVVGVVLFAETIYTRRGGRGR